MNAIKVAIKKEPVFCVSALLALVSCFIVLPDAQYAGYIDLRVLALLYCLMVVVAGVEKAGLFERIATALLKKSKSGKALCVVLVMLCFFSSMVVTNDVALITFTPFAILVMGASGQQKSLPWVISLQTIAANLGSMLTPVGNPQNLYLYTRYQFDGISFFGVTLPWSLISFAVLVILCLILPIRKVEVNETKAYPKMNTQQTKEIITCFVLFCLCLGTVFHLMDWHVLLVAVVVVLAVIKPKLLKGADFVLLATFVCFFVFAGNLARIPALQEFLSQAMQNRETLVSALVSQVISNVPAAVLLSGFTQQGKALLLGVNLGGLGTPIASLASFISLKAYSKMEHADVKRYLAIFSVLNFGILAVLLLLSELMK